MLQGSLSLSLSLSLSVVSFRNSNGWDRIYFLNIKNWGHDKSVTKNTTTSHRYILAADRWPSCSLLVRKPEEHNEDDHSHRAANTGWAWASALHFTHSGPAGVQALHPPLSHLAWASFSVRLPIKQQASGSSFSLADLFSHWFFRAWWSRGPWQNETCTKLFIYPTWPDSMDDQV